MDQLAAVDKQRTQVVTSHRQELTELTTRTKFKQPRHFPPIGEGLV